jgi:hypothetical protein
MNFDDDDEFLNNINLSEIIKNNNNNNNNNNIKDIEDLYKKPKNVIISEYDNEEDDELFNNINLSQILKNIEKAKTESSLKHLYQQKEGDDDEIFPHLSDKNCIFSVVNKVIECNSKECSKHKIIYATIKDVSNGMNVGSNFIVDMNDDWEGLNVREGFEFYLILNDQTTTKNEKLTCSILKNEKQSTLLIQLSSFCKSLVIFHPHLLISPTLVIKAFNCIRKAVLTEVAVIQGKDEIIQSFLYGNIIHEVVATAMERGLSGFNLKNLEELLDRSINSNIQEIFAASLTEISVKNALLEYIPQLHIWANNHFVPSPSSSSSSQQQQQQQQKLMQRVGSEKENSVKKSEILIKRSTASECVLWSPELGLKGKIDAIILAKLNNNNNKEEDEEGYFELPFELKTGKGEK